MTAPAVHAAGVGKVFPSTGGEVTALTGVDLDVAAGEFVSLIGPSGCGKSTLLRLIADLDTPSAGDLAIFGKPARQARIDQDYGIAFQQAGLLPWRTVAANIALPLELHRWSRARRDARVAELADLVGLSEFVGRYPDQLSGGMQQRVAIARAIAYRPEVLVMDEPFASVDAQTRFELEDLCLRIREQFGMTIVVVTHDIDEAVYLSDRVVVLGERPAKVTEIIEIDFSGPRDQLTTRALPVFAELRTRIFELIRKAG